MIIDQFIDEEEIIRPPGFYKRKEKILDVCLITFSHEIFSFAKNMEGSVVVGEMHAAGGVYEIIKLPVKEKRVGIFLSPCGSPAAGGFMEDVNAVTGVENYILFGSCGSLDSEKTKGKYIVVDEAYRDEGLSYHYIPPSDYISVPTWSVTRDFFEKNNIPYVLVYPEKDRLDEWVGRCYIIGNNKAFIDTMIEHWDEWITECENEDGCTEKIPLKSGYLWELIKERSR